MIQPWSNVGLCEIYLILLTAGSLLSERDRLFIQALPFAIILDGNSQLIADSGVFRDKGHDSGN